MMYLTPLNGFYFSLYISDLFIFISEISNWLILKWTAIGDESIEPVPTKHTLSVNHYNTCLHILCLAKWHWSGWHGDSVVELCESTEFRQKRVDMIREERWSRWRACKRRSNRETSANYCLRSRQEASTLSSHERLINRRCRNRGWRCHAAIQDSHLNNNSLLVLLKLLPITKKTIKCIRKKPHHLCAVIFCVKRNRLLLSSIPEFWRATLIFRNKTMKSMNYILVSWK
jgi:hypothetical protein